MWPSNLLYLSCQAEAYMTWYMGVKCQALFKKLRLDSAWNHGCEKSSSCKPAATIYCPPRPPPFWTRQVSGWSNAWDNKTTRFQALLMLFTTRKKWFRYVCTGTCVESMPRLRNSFISACVENRILALCLW